MTRWGVLVVPLGREVAVTIVPAETGEAWTREIATWDVATLDACDDDAGGAGLGLEVRVFGHGIRNDIATALIDPAGVHQYGPAVVVPRDARGWDVVEARRVADVLREVVAAWERSRRATREVAMSRVAVECEREREPREVGGSRRAVCTRRASRGPA